MSLRGLVLNVCVAVAKWQDPARTEDDSKRIVPGNKHGDFLSVIRNFFSRFFICLRSIHHLIRINDRFPGIHLLLD